MHPDTYKLAAYLDGALDEAERAATRAHILTCVACSARLERLRDDGRRIATFAAGAAPDVRAAVRARLRRSGPAAWVTRGGALAAGLAALLLFAILIGVGAGGTGTVGYIPDRLFVVDKQFRQLLELDANSGAVVKTIAVGGEPSRVQYDQRYDRLYALLAQAVVAVDARTLRIVARWDASYWFDVNSGMALDERRGRLYIAHPSTQSIELLDTATFTPTGSFQVGVAPGALALTPDGDKLFALDSQGTLWTIDPLNGKKSAQSLSRGARWLRGWLAISPDGQTLYVLRYGIPATLQRIDVRSGQIGDPVQLEGGQPPQDLLLLDADHLAISRGDGIKGGIEIVTTESFSKVDQLDPDYDQHHLVGGPGGTLFALNWLHGTATRYNLGANERVWHITLQGRQPYDGVFIPGGWHWPWQP